MPRYELLFTFRTASEEEKALALGLSAAITSGFGNSNLYRSYEISSFLQIFC